MSASSLPIGALSSSPRFHFTIALSLPIGAVLRANQISATPSWPIGAVTRAGAVRMASQISVLAAMLSRPIGAFTGAGAVRRASQASDFAATPSLPSGVAAEQNHRLDFSVMLSRPFGTASIE